MSKFKVGDKVYRLEDRKEANILWEVSSIKVMKKGDKEYHNYVLKTEGSKVAFVNLDDDLELYKTPHDKLLELGWKLIHEDENMIIYNKSLSKALSFHKKNADCFTDERNIDLQLAEVLVDYLKELENETL